MARRGWHPPRGALPWAAGIWLLWRVRPPEAEPAAPDRGEHPPPRLSVIVPARDEARALPGLLASLRAQRRPPDEVLVVDDHSRDSTPAVARAGGARVLASSDLPEGWTGKTWACHQGASEATGDVLLFLDADVTLHPQALGALLGEWRRRGGFVSVQPYHRVERPYETLSAVANAVALMGTGAFTGAPRRPAALAFGACLLAGRADYERAGGHAHPEVRPRITEDIGLARRARQLGIPLTVLAGRDLVAFRMYPQGLAQLVEGWSKALAAGVEGTPPLLGALVAAWVSGALVAAGRGTRALTPWRRRGDLAAYVAWAAELWWLLRRVGRFGPATAALFPAPLVAFVALAARSAALAGSGRDVPWRGRTVAAVTRRGQARGQAESRSASGRASVCTTVRWRVARVSAT